jgi:hypothetical protein
LIITPEGVNKELSSYKVSMDIASDMLQYPKQHWNLIILEICEEPFDLNFLKSREQFWMLWQKFLHRKYIIIHFFFEKKSYIYILFRIEV